MGEAQSMTYEDVWYTLKELHCISIHTERNLGNMCKNGY